MNLSSELSHRNVFLIDKYELKLLASELYFFLILAHPVYKM